MKISSIFNRSKLIGRLGFYVFNAWHGLRRLGKSKKNVEFNIFGDEATTVYVPLHPIPENNLYGHIEVLRAYLGGAGCLKNIHIQHGVIFSDLVQQIMVDSYAETIITFSKSRAKVIKQVAGSKNVIAIGPYIKYASCRLTTEALHKWKQAIGRTLLVFPSHSAVGRAKVNFSHDTLVDEIIKVKNENDIQTVMINLYFTDLDSHWKEYYEGFGFTVCSAGYWLSENFLPNLKTLIMLSDYTMSNSAGTHVGYCLALDKPHYIYKQALTVEILKGRRAKEDMVQAAKHKGVFEKNKEIIESAFSQPKFVISERQMNVVSEYWGNDLFFTKSELIDLLSRK